MMEFMRNMAAGWVAKIFMGLLVLSFAVWGIADIFRGFGAGAVAKVGDSEIDARSYQVELNKELRILSNRLGQTITTQQSAAFGLPFQVLERMIGDATLNDVATTYNIGISSKELAKTISQDPNFQFSGSFDRAYMQQVLRSLGTTEDRYVLDTQARQERRQLAAGLAGNATVPVSTLKAFNAFANEKRDIDYLVLKESDLGEIADPSDADLTKYYDAQKTAFRAPEYRTFTMLKLEPGDIADPSTVSDDDVLTYYETQAQRFGEPEKRQVQQILFPSAEEAQEAADKIKAGTSFADIATERNLKAGDIDLGLITKQELSDKAAADAAFALADTGVTEVIKGRFGHILINVQEIKPAQKTPLAEVKDLLKAEIATQRAGDEVLDMYDRVEDERAGGATLQEVSKKFDLPLRTIKDISKAGDLETGDKVTDLPEQEKLLTAVFSNEVDYEADPVDVNNNGFVWFNVDDIKASRERKLDEVKDKVIAAWKATELARLNKERAEKLQKEIKAGKSIEDVAAAENLTASQVTEIGRQTRDQLPANAIEQVFNGPKGFVTTAVDGTNQYVLQVAQIVEPEFSKDNDTVKALTTTLKQNAERDLLVQFIVRKQRDLGYSVNQPMLDQIVSSSR